MIAHAFKQTKFYDVSWESLQVGDLIIVLENELVPADLVLFQSSNEEGECYLQTASLDG